MNCKNCECDEFKHWKLQFVRSICDQVEKINDGIYMDHVSNRSLIALGSLEKELEMLEELLSEDEDACS